jgi:hypothetical protein
MFSTLPIPEYSKYGEPTMIYGAKGTQGTCTTQGFFIQLGYTSIFYNVALSFYYLVTVRYSWREVQTRRYAKWFHIPLLCGLALALTGIPFYGNSFLSCYLPPPPLAKNNRIIVALSTAPIATSILVATVNMLLVYAKVRKQDARANRWRMSARASSSSRASSNVLERAVFWQSVFYLGAFYAVWPITMMAYLQDDKEARRFPYWLTMVALAPLQGT